jgi:hypothetical protein
MTHPRRESRSEAAKKRAFSHGSGGPAAQYALEGPPLR